MAKEFEFKPFDKVLVRDDNDDLWVIDLYGYKDSMYPDCRPFVCLSNSWNQCIPYEGNEHLLGTTDDYEPPYVPKDGDFVTFVAYVSQIKFTSICYIYKNFVMYYYVGTVGRERNKLKFNNSYSLDSRDVVRPATEEEKQQLLSKLHEIGKDWDAEKKEIVDWKWEPIEGERYWCVRVNGEVRDSTWDGCEVDMERYEFGNCFRTREEAQAMSEKIRKLLKGE